MIRALPISPTAQAVLPHPDQRADAWIYRVSGDRFAVNVPTGDPEALKGIFARLDAKSGAGSHIEPRDPLRLSVKKRPDRFQATIMFLGENTPENGVVAKKK